ncbi:MAG: TusE/DsrC/DsvC family sulfur relay protein [Thiohalocapsa sp.]
MAESMQEIMNPGAFANDADFPNAPEDWSREAAEATAREESVELTADHWAVIAALQHYFKNHDNPNVRALHDALDERFHAQGGLKYLYEIFPGGPVAQGCRLAGLEPPPGAVDKSFGSVQ